MFASLPGAASPPNFIPEVLVVPAPLICSTAAVLNSATSVQELPFQLSTLLSLLLPSLPAKAMAEVDIPNIPKLFLAVFTSFTSVQLVPFQVSTAFDCAVPVYPATAIAAVYGPLDPIARFPLAVFKSFFSVQLVPSHCSVRAMFPVEVSPPKAKVTVLADPAEACVLLAVLISAISVQDVPL
mgnify:CR=1 FL=1